MTALDRATASQLQAELECALGFSESDLGANRAGRLTRQQALLVAIRGTARLLLNAYLVILFFVVVLMPLSSVPSLWNEVPNPNGLIVGGLGTCIFFVAFGWFSLAGVRRSLGSGTVASCEGAMSVTQKLVEMERGYSYAHTLVAGADGYSVPFAAYRVFEDGEQYRAFFIPESKIVVAIEAFDLFGQSGRLKHRHRWGHLDMQLWWLLLLAGSAAVLVAGALAGSAAVVLLGLGNLLVWGLVARVYVRGA